MIPAGVVVPLHALVGAKSRLGTFARRSTRWAPAAAVAIFSAVALGAAYAQPPPQSLRPTPNSCLRAAVESARAVIAAPRVGSEFGARVQQIDISRDGSEVAYTVVEPDIDHNVYRLSLWIASTAARTPPRRVADEGSSSTLVPTATPRFSPDGRRLAYLEQRAGKVRVDVLDLATGRSEQFGGGSAGDRGWTIRTTAGLEWSPDGRFLAFGVGERAPAHSEHAPRGVETGTEWVEDAGSDEPDGLALLRVADGKVQKIIDPTVDVRDFDWSPDGSRIAVSASPRSVPAYLRFMYTDIYILDVRSRRLSPLVVQPGRDDDPSWSPNGRAVAFLSSGGVLDWMQRRIPAYVDVATRRIVYPHRASITSLSGGAVESRPTWSSDGKSVIVRLLWKLRSAIYEVPVAGGPLRNLTGDDLASYYDVRVSADGRTMAYTRQAVDEPSDLFVTPTDRFAPRRLTRFSSAFRSAFGDGARPEMASWRSEDRRWTIHGSLIPGATACAARARPLLVFVQGGPSMVRTDFNLDAQFPLLAFARGGVTVLAPNTRGREGFGRPFFTAMSREGHWGSGPLSDILAGVDYLEAERCVGRGGDVGIVGHSYGGYLVAYSITQTRRFAAAVIFEAAGAPLFAGQLYLTGSNPAAQAVRRQLYGMGLPFGKGYAEIQRESPLPQMGNARTPTLLEFGNSQLGGEDAKNGVELFQTLQHYGVPSRFIRYPEIGHRISESVPASQLDSARRVLDWYWYWVLHDPVPDLVREFGPRPSDTSSTDPSCAPRATPNR